MRNELLGIYLKRNKMTKFLIVVVVSMCFANSRSQITEGSSNDDLGESIKNDFISIFKTPIQMDNKNSVQLLALAILATGCIASMDVQITQEFFEKEVDADFDDQVYRMGQGMAQIGYRYDKISSSYILGGLTASMLAGGLLSNNKKMLLTTKLMVESLFITESLTALGKGLLGRSRPYAGRGAYDFHFFKFSLDSEYQSMPSGHTSAVFSMITVLANQYDTWWVKIPAYSLGVSVALQRIDARKHWASDVILGGLLGYYVGRSLSLRHQKKDHFISVSPNLSSNGAGVCIRF